MTVRVLVVDDEPLLRAAVRAFVDAVPDLAAVGEASNGVEALAVCQRERPDVVLMDIRMPEMDGIEATRRITNSLPDARVLVLTTFDLDEYVYGALRAGASGFVLKDTPAEQLLHAIRVVAAGEALLSPTVTRRLISQFSTRPTAASLTGVTGREREVLTLIGHGLSNAELAARLHLSPATVSTHITRLLAKLQARDRAQLVIAAYETGLVRPRTV